MIGAIFGTGTNGAYIDRVETIKKLGEEAIAEAKKGGPTAGEFMVINTEWGAIDNGVREGYDPCSGLLADSASSDTTCRYRRLTTSSTEKASTREFISARDEDRALTEKLVV